MPTVSTKELGKEFVSKYGETISYLYGQEQGTCGVYVYRITNVNFDGHEIDLPWNAVVQRCSELGVKAAPELKSTFVFDGNYEELQAIIDWYTSGESTLDNSHIREGCCVRVERGLDTTIYKSKSFEFCVLEGIIKSNDNYVDTEEAS